MISTAPLYQEYLRSLVHKQTFSYFDCLCSNLAFVLESYGLSSIEIFGKSWVLNINAEMPLSISEEITRKQKCIFEFISNKKIIWRESKCISDLRLGNGPFLVLSDAYYLSWTPYYQRKHIEHGYLVYKIESCFLIIDPYFTDSEWGGMSGYSAVISDNELKKIPIQKITNIHTDFALQNKSDTSFEIKGDLKISKEEFSEKTSSLLKLYSLSENQDALSIDTWVLMRNRLLLHKFLTKYDVGNEPTKRFFENEILPAWRKAQESSYMSFRRVQRGREALPQALYDIKYALKLEYEIANRTTGERLCL